MKSSVYTPVYKPLLRFRESLVNNKKIYFFKKQKWNTYLNNLKKNKKKIIDQSLYHKPIFGFFFKKTFFFNLLTKQKINTVYGGLKLKYYKRLDLNYKKALFNSLYTSYESFLFRCLETRLDSTLYKTFFCKSYREARNWIFSGDIYVNNLLVNRNSFSLKKGDIISINPRRFCYIKANLLAMLVAFVPSIGYEIDFRCLRIFIFSSITSENSFEALPFKLETNKFSSYLKKS